MSKKFLLISYYWPPVTGGGVHRWLKMTKYLPKSWEGHVYTPQPSEFSVKDDSLVEQVNKNLIEVRTPIWEPYGFYQKFMGKKKSDKLYSGFIEEKGGESWTKKISIFIRGNFFLPDARMFWIKPSIKFLKKYVEEHKIDYIISTGPPHSMHLIALGLKKAYPNLKWIADFRDPWSNINFYEKLNTTAWADKKTKKQEKSVLTTANKVVTVSKSWASDLSELAHGKEVQVITNGFDPQDFPQESIVDQNKFTFIHVGSMNADRNPIILWKSLKKLLSENPSLEKVLEIKLVGVVDFKIIQSIQEFGLEKFLNKIDFLAHKEAIRHLRKAQVLILPINTTKDSMGILPGKLFEYLGAKRPIFCICPEGSDSERIINETNAGAIVNYEEEDRAYEVVKEWHVKFEKGNLGVESQATNKYSRKELMQEYIALLEAL